MEICADRFSDWFKSHISKLRRISSELAQKRGSSLYGIERLGRLPSELLVKMMLGVPWRRLSLFMSSVLNSLSTSMVLPSI